MKRQYQYLIKGYFVHHVSINSPIPTPLVGGVKTENEDDEEYDIDQLLAELKEEIDAPNAPSARPSPEPLPPLTEEHKIRYTALYDKICRFLIDTYPKEIEKLEDLTEEQWKYPDPAYRSAMEKKIHSILNPSARQKLMELLGGNMTEMRLFYTWLHQQNEEEM